MPATETTIEDSHGNPKPVCEWTTEEWTETLILARENISQLSDQVKANDKEIACLSRTARVMRNRIEDLEDRIGKIFVICKGS